MASLSVVIATVSRSGLEPLLTELSPQMSDDDEIIVVGDGPQPKARSLCKPLVPKVRYIEYGPVRCWGHPQRSVGMRLASKEYVSFLNDDDMVAPAYVQGIKSAAQETPGRPLIFRMINGSDQVWWQQAVVPGNVSTQMAVLPNIKERLGIWGRSYQGDFLFLKSTLKTYPEGEGIIAWRSEVIVIHGHRFSAPLQSPSLKAKV